MMAARGRAMKASIFAAAVAAGIGLAGCATSSDGDGSGYSAGIGVGNNNAVDLPERTFYCPESLGDCRDQAEAYCGELGYTRVREAGHTGGGITAGTMTSVGSSRSSSEIRRRAEIAADDDGSMTVRCKKPKEPTD